MPKPKNKKKKFIDRKNEQSVTFKLIHRGQRDPLAADEDTPQRVLQVIKNPNLEKQKEEQRNCGIYFDDHYNYLQHLKDRKDEGKDFSALDRFLIQAKESKVKLPPSVLPSKEEEEVGLLNKAAPRRGPLIDWDPDIVAGLDEDFDFEDPDNVLDDNFMELANASGDEGGGDEEEDNDHYFDTDEERDELGSLENFSDEETKSRFTNYSMSSSIIRRNEGLKLLDDKFENFYAEYDDMNIGSLACDDIEGNRPEASDMMENIVNDFNKQKEEERDRNMKFENKYAYVNEDEVDDLKSNFERVQVQEEDGWDCETILSTYSNIYNHPKLISERKVDPIQISGKTGMPKNVLGKGLTASALKRFDALNGELENPSSHETMTHASRVSELSFRNKYETKEEKRARKEGMKEYKRERRIERKANREAFRNEKVRQEKIQLNNRNNQQGIKLI